MMSPEVHLNCMKPMEDEPPNQLVPQGSGKALVARNSWPSMLAALVGFLATAVFLG